MTLDPHSPELVLVAGAADAQAARERLPPPLWERYPPSWRPPALPTRRIRRRRQLGAASALAATAGLLLVMHPGSGLRRVLAGSPAASPRARVATPPPGAGYVAANGLGFTVGTDGASVVGLAVHGCGPAILLPAIPIRSGRFALQARVGARRVSVDGRFTDAGTAFVNVLVTTVGCRRTSSGSARLS